MSFLEFLIEDRVGYLKLNRPEIHNAFDEILIEELNQFFLNANKDNTFDAIVVSGNGKSFCAGADLNWMKKMVNYSEEENLADSMKLAMMLKNMNECEKPVIGLVDGATMGGGVGLVSCMDFVVATKRSFFALSEVKLGILPAVISPFVIAKIGESNARRYFISGERFNAASGKDVGLIHEAVDSLDDASEVIGEYVKQVKSSAPKARESAKKLVRTISSELKTLDSKIDHTCRLISKVRTSEEGQEGMGALLEKRKPSWQD